MTEWFSRLKDQCLVWLPNMPSNYIENAIQRSVSRFFRETHLLKDDVYFDAACGVNDFVLDIPENRTIIQARYVRSTRDPERRPLVSHEWTDIPPAADRFQPGYWLDLQGSIPTVAISDCYAMRDGRYCLTYTWTPSGRDCEIPQHFIGKYIDALEHGALALLYLIPTDADTMNPTMARYHLQEFDRAIKDAGAEETQNHTQRTLYMRGHDFI